MTTPSDTRPGIAHAEVDAVMTRGRKRVVVEEGHDSIPVRVPVPKAETHAHIEVAVGATIGLPNYSAVRFDVRLRLPCKADLESVERSYAAALAFCEKKLNEMKDTVA